MNIKPRDNAEFIHAWADGATIEFWWVRDQSWIDAGEPPYSKGTSYRIKPAMIDYKVAQMRDLSTRRVYMSAAQDVSEERMLETSSGFMRWLTDWVEVENKW